jgi:hypothetical protein
MNTADKMTMKVRSDLVNETDKKFKSRMLGDEMPLFHAPIFMKVFSITTKTKKENNA